MKQKLLLKVMLLLCALIAGSSSVWAESETFTFGNGNGKDVKSTTAVTKNGVTVAVTQNGASNAPNFSSDANDVRFQDGNKMSITSTGTITQVVITYTSAAYAAKITQASFNVGTYSYKENATTGTWTGSSNNIEIVNKAGSQTRISQIAITYTTGSGGSSDPSITANDVNITYSATSGSIGYTLANATGNVSATVTTGSDWLTLGTITSSAVPFTCSANTETTRTATVTLSFTGASNKVVTVTQNGAKYKVYIQAPTGGTLEVKNGETPVSDGDAVNDGTTLTITPTASDGYRYRNWQAVDASTHTYTTGYNYTINEHDVTIKANFDAEYSVNWSVNGNVTSTVKYINNETIVFPSRPTDIFGKKFVGWTATEIAGIQADVPTLLDYGTKMGTSNVTYYAVFADASGESSTATLTESEIKANFTNATMAYGTEKTYNDTSDGLTWVASGYSEGTPCKWVQMKKANNSYFNVSTTKNIEDVKLTITNANNSTGGAQDITKHGEFAGTVCLESEAQSTPKGALASSNVVTSNTVTVSLPISSKEFYIQTTAGARVWGIELSTNNYTYSNYRTTVPTTATISLNAACTDGDLVYGTYSSSSAFVVPSGLTVSALKVDGDGKLVVMDYAEGDIVKANTGVMVSATTAGDKTITLSSEVGTEKDGNLLKPSGDAGIDAEAMATAAPSCKYYRLTMHNETTLGFYWGAASGAAFALGANKAYLAVPAGTSAPSFFEFGGDVTGIEAMETSKTVENGEYYNLAGQRVANPTKGLYIVNGKKVVIK